MNVHIFSFTMRAAKLSLYIYERLSECEDSVEMHPKLYSMPAYCLTDDFNPIASPLKDVVEKCFFKGEALIFVSACAIAVRSIAPFIKSKADDPCVIAIDEEGKYAVSLLSGHLGGANELTIRICELINAAPVISTATDINKKFAVDSFAKNNFLQISDLKIAKNISASILNNKTVGFTIHPLILPYIHINNSIPLPENILYLSEGFSESSIDTGFSITAFTNSSPFKNTLQLFPKMIVLGIGCKKGISPVLMRRHVLKTLFSCSLNPLCVRAIASIDLKKNEPALIELAAYLNVPFVTYDSGELLKVSGSVSYSRFVEQITGVDNVCERAALKCSGAKHLFAPKSAREGITTAIAFSNVEIHF